MKMKKNYLTVIITATLLTACGEAQQNSTTPTSAVTPVIASSTIASNTASRAAFHGTNVSQENIGGDFTLTDGNGKPFQLSSLKGKVVMLSFGFTHCPDVCPTELLTYSDTLKQLGEQSKDVAVVFVSVDYERDTPELIGKYVAQFDPNFIGLTDSTGGQDIAQIKQQYRIVSAKTDIKSDTIYNVDHSSGTYLLDKDGDTVLFEPYGTEAPQIAADIKKLLEK